MKDKTINIGLLGFGNVGAAVHELLQANAAGLSAKSGVSIHIKRVAVRDLKKQRTLDSSFLTSDVESIIDDSEITVVVELMGDCPEALNAMKRALSLGKSVVTANKAVIARHGKELFDLAAVHQCEIFFEASVAGGIPILRALREGLAGNRLTKLVGIINGTSNYILTEMCHKGTPFADVLKEAQRLGYAEADPTSDVEGFDAAFKLSILILLAYGKFISVDQIFRQGITQIMPLDFEMAQRFGYVVRLLGIAKADDDCIEARVHPTMIRQDNPLAHVEGPFNAILYDGDFVGEGMLYGRGAGGRPTASAIVADLIEACRNQVNKVPSSLSPIGFPLAGLVKVQPRAMSELHSDYYLRFMATDKPGVLARVTGLLGQHGISISSVYQHGHNEDEEVPIVVFTHKAKESAIQKSLSEIDKMDFITQKTQLIRIEE
jgi:homoserine dehydrogenase